VPNPRSLLEQLNHLRAVGRRAATWLSSDLLIGSRAGDQPQIAGCTQMREIWTEQWCFQGRVKSGFGVVRLGEILV
jgi:hypothetical protein